MKYIIVDIDGTIAEPGERLKYLNQDPPDWDKFYQDDFNDAPIQPIVNLINSLYGDPNYRIVFCTARREIAREKTYNWLLRHFYIGDIHPLPLLMRRDDDERHDSEVKPELINGINLRPENVAFILEDRDSMVKKWRELGYTCLQVADNK